MKKKKDPQRITKIKSFINNYSWKALLRVKGLSITVIFIV